MIATTAPFTVPAIGTNARRLLERLLDGEAADDNAAYALATAPWSVQAPAYIPAYTVPTVNRAGLWLDYNEAPTAAPRIRLDRDLCADAGRLISAVLTTGALVITAIACLGVLILTYLTLATGPASAVAFAQTVTHSVADIGNAPLILHTSDSIIATLASLAGS
jgi:hypothetical protein